MLFRPTNIKLLFAAMLSLTMLGQSSLPTRAEEAGGPSDKILDALKVNAAKDGREGEFDDVIKALSRAGYLHKHYDAKADYAEQWRVLKPLNLFGNPVLAVTNEREGKFIGCCFDSRTTIVMAATGDLGKLREFAGRNACKFFHDEKSDQEMSRDTLKALKVKTDATEFAELWCGAGDVLGMK